MEEVNNDCKLMILQYHNYNNRLTESLQQLRQTDELTDVTLTCDSRDVTSTNQKCFQKFRKFRAHKLLLSVASPYFRELFVENPCDHPVVMLTDTSAEELEAILNFVYNGEVQIRHDELDSFIRAAKHLQVFDVGEDGEEHDDAITTTSTTTTAIAKQDCKISSSRKSCRRARRPRKFSTSVAEDDVLNDKEEEAECLKTDTVRKSSWSVPAGKGRKQKDIYDMQHAKKQKVDEEDDSGSDNFQCRECGLTFWSAVSRKTHQELHNFDSVCETCGKTLCHPLLVAEHKKSHDMVEAQNNSSAEASNHQEEAMNFVQGEYEVVSNASYAHVIDDSSGNIRIIVTEDPRSGQKVDGSKREDRIVAAKPIITGRSNFLTFEDVFTILSGNDEDIFSNGETSIPVRAKAGEVYAFTASSEVTVKKHLRADGYMWVNKRTQFSPNGAIAKTYFYARTDNGHNNEFVKHEYMLKDGTRALIHYLGDETKYKDRQHGNSKRNSAFFFRTSKLVTDQIIEQAHKKPSEVYETILANDPGGSDGYLRVVTKPRNPKQINNVLMRAKKRGTAARSVTTIQNTSLNSSDVHK